MASEYKDLQAAYVKADVDYNFDVLVEAFESTLHDVANLYCVTKKFKGASWEDIELRHLLGKLNKAIPSFWSQCPDRRRGMLAEITEVILDALMIAERLKSDGD